MKKLLAQALTGVRSSSPRSTFRKAMGEKVHMHRKHLGIQHTVAEIAALATLIRKHIITMLLEAQSGHSAGALGMADVFAALYFAVLEHDPTNPEWDERDRVILSNGHICPVLYATLAEAGYFSKTQLQSLRKMGSKLQGHPHFLANPEHNNTVAHPENLPGIENTSGPLGQGLSQAIGLATALKMKKSNAHVFAIISDGELQEGQTWEALLYAGNKKIHNLIVLIDRNEIQIGGFTESIVPLEPLHQKLEDFNWNVQTINGHNIENIITACTTAKRYRLGPSIIICNTIPGKAVNFMENLPEWHGKPPTQEEAKEALADLRSLKGRIWWE